MTELLILKPEDLIASGKQRHVFLHPTDPSKLVKVLRSTPETAGRSAFTNFVERHFPGAITRQIRKEYEEYLRLMLQNPEPDVHVPITHMYGFVMTDQGLGCLTERVGTKDSEVARTLSDLLRQGDFAQKHLDRLNDMVERLYRYNVRAGDLTARNLVFGRRGSGPSECVLVDGFGDIHAIPVRSLARWANRLGLDDSLKRLGRRTGLEWRPETRQFFQSALSSGI